MNMTKGFTATTVYLPDVLPDPYITISQNSPHASVQFHVLGFNLAAWSPQTLRDLADVCIKAADDLELELAKRRPYPLPRGVLQAEQATV